MASIGYEVTPIDIYLRNHRMCIRGLVTDDSWSTAGLWNQLNDNQDNFKIT